MKTFALPEALAQEMMMFISDSTHLPCGWTLARAVTLADNLRGMQSIEESSEQLKQKNPPPAE